MDLAEKFKIIKEKLLQHEFMNMNENQRKAIFKIDGQLTVFAGAGSGKTTVLINRIFFMVKYGDIYEKNDVPGLTNELIKELEIGFEKSKTLYDIAREAFEKNNKELFEFIKKEAINPQNILAITFTNKAAKELKDRLQIKLGHNSLVNASTFHSFCVKILRSHAEEIGFTNSFTIYDSDDSLKLIKFCQKILEVDEKVFSVKNIISTISRAKDSFVNFDDFKLEHQDDFRTSHISRIYEMYQNKLKEANAMDFDDLIYNTIKLFQKKPEILDAYKELYKYIMVDEYQDINFSQRLLIGQLTGTDGNICVVGDDDQSIYKFRGAVVENILNFEREYKNAVVVRLEENYRSTKNILLAANSVIENNINRKGKTLWTQNSEGCKIKLFTACSEHNESDIVAKDIKRKVTTGNCKYSDFAVLYRMSSQSNILERVFIKNSIPYKIVGGLKFFERREIKDLVSYLNVINNPYDEVRLKRIINKPKRSIGERTISQVNAIAIKENKPLYEIMKNASKYSSIGRCVFKLYDFVEIIELLTESYKKNNSIIDIYNEILERIKYIEYLQQENDESDARIANIKELASAIVRYEKESKNPTLSGFLEEISLAPENSKENDEDDQVVLMTMHAAKGLEFDYLYLPGFEEGIFPGVQCAFKPEDIEEERRLAYVAITRAKKELFILHATSRMVFGSTSYNKPSRFLEEIPTKIISKVKSNDWEQPKNSDEKLISSYELRVKSVLSARNFSFPSSDLDIKKTKLESIFNKGEDVNHEIFGKGKILSITPQRDKVSLLEIEFERFGVKKLTSATAKLQKEI